ncbi:hypothetical protein HMH01_13165 [Halovulum dunhuangense]|uniref:DUF4402 domain-containing protein n=1 Tax=Halovulum dunhuangense TaxID=1505036 RepID=A0A849L4V4_9RHOB|nr:hypothetical protein [Halovulum dunhuangense]NNU81386.1 hypothetical protein [Halovulum dunhuangense]
MPVTAAPRFSTALLASAFVLGTAVLAQDPGGLVTGSFGDQPLELPVSADLSAATMIGDYADASLAAALTEGDQGPLFLTMTLSGELPDPGEVMLELAFARDMGRNWQGDQNSLTLELGGFAPSDGMVHLFGTITGEVTGGPASETRAVTFSFDAYLEQVE